MPHLSIIPDVEETGLSSLQSLLDKHPSARNVGDLKELGEVIHLADDAQIEVAGLAHGTKAGNPTVSFTFMLPDGKAVFAETTLALFLSAADMLKARHGDPRL